MQYYQMPLIIEQCGYLKKNLIKLKIMNQRLLIIINPFITENGFCNFRHMSNS